MGGPAGRTFAGGLGDGEGRGRFEVAGDDAALDTATGLMWPRWLGDPRGPNLDFREAAEHCRGLSLAGYTDWRPATRYELMTVVDFGVQRPALDPVVFPLADDDRIWTATADADNDNESWAMATSDGGFGRRHRNDENRAGCVRGPDPPIHRERPEGLERRERFVARTIGGDAANGRPGNPVVHDSRTGLLWQGEERGDENWEHAHERCAEVWGRRGDWRLPTIHELASLLDDRRGSDPVIDIQAFPNWSGDDHWSSTPDVDDPEDRGWAIDFDRGEVTRKADHEHARVRCVTGD